MSHADARLTEYARLLAARRVEQGHKPGEVAKQPGVSRQTIYKPHRSPRRTPLEVELRIVAPGWTSTPAQPHWPGSCSCRPPGSGGPAPLAAAAPGPGRPTDRRDRPPTSDRRQLRTGPAQRAAARRCQEAGQGAGRRRLARPRPRSRRWTSRPRLGLRARRRRRPHPHRLCRVLSDEKGPTCAAFLHRAATWFCQWPCESPSPVARLTSPRVAS